MTTLVPAPAASADQPWPVDIGSMGCTTADASPDSFARTATDVTDAVP